MSSIAFHTRAVHHDGCLQFQGTCYWHRALVEHAGYPLYVALDDDALQVLDSSLRYVCRAPRWISGIGQAAAAEDSDDAFTEAPFETPGHPDARMADEIRAIVRALNDAAERAEFLGVVVELSERPPFAGVRVFRTVEL